jgi:transposase
MANILGDEKKHQILALGRLGWPLRRIEHATGVRRETASAYLKAAGIAIREPRRRRPPAKPASRVSTDPANPASEVSTDPAALPPGLVAPSPWPPPTSRAPAASACEPYRGLIEQALGRGRNAMAIWQDLVDDHGFPARYASVRRFVRTLRGQRPAEAHPVIVTAPGEEGQVDYGGDGPMVRHPGTRKYRRARLFVFTLGYSRKSVRLLTFTSSTRRWAELHEETFRRLGGASATVVLDNLKEGVLTPDVYDPTLNPLFRDVLTHYGAVALPCRIRHANRKGKVEAAVGHAQATPLKGLRFESLEEAQAYLDRWETRWADTRIHGTTKRQVAAMFAEEQPSLHPLPLEPFRYYVYGARTVHLDGCVAVAGAYYAPPPGWLGREVAVQWDDHHVRLLDPADDDSALARRRVVDRPVHRPGGDEEPEPRQPLDQAPAERGTLALGDDDVVGGEAPGHRILVGEMVREDVGRRPTLEHAPVRARTRDIEIVVEDRDPVHAAEGPSQRSAAPSSTMISALPATRPSRRAKFAPVASCSVWVAAPHPSSTSAQRKPRSAASRAVPSTQEFVEIPVKTSCSTPRARSSRSKPVE